jgi:hypothetical protein
MLKHLTIENWKRSGSPLSKTSKTRDTDTCLEQTGVSGLRVEYIATGLHLLSL